MRIEDAFVDESVLSVWARKGGQAGLREKPAKWRVAKRGTIFFSAPDLSRIDLYKDVTHLYRVRKNGKKKGRKEWATTFWMQDRDVQILRTSAEVSNSEYVFLLKVGI
jgi:hypothetical protein